MNQIEFKTDGTKNMKNKKGFLQGALCGALAMLLAAGLVSCGLKAKNSNSGEKDTTEAISSETDKKLEKLESLINQYYLKDVDQDELQQGIYEGYIAGLNDPYSVYYDEEATKSFQESTDGEYDGIGAVMSQNKETGIITISQVYEGSPAEQAGMKDNDILYKVEDEEVTGKDLTEVVSKIKGEKGTDVNLTVLRGDDREEVAVTATRDTIEYPTVSSKMLDNGIGYLRITEFDSVTYDQYKNAYNDLKNQGMKGMVVDLRSNPGGSLSIVCKILDEILPEGKIVYTQDKNGKEEDFTSDEEHQIDIPMTVLVNQYSASASEIFAGAIQGYDLGAIVGTQTYGKGVVQQIFDLKDGTCVKLTIAKYFTAKGQDIDGKGITPDVAIDYQADENNPEADNQLNKAIETLQGEMQ